MSTRASRTSWSGDPPQRGAARERLLEAASTCVARDGLAGLGIASVASEAGVSRPTVYRYFADRDALVAATLLRTADLFSRRLGERLEALPGPSEQAVEAVMVSLQAVPRNPVLGELWSAAALDTSAVQGFTSRLAIGLTRRALAPLVRTARWSDDEADEAIEVLLRFILSLLAAPEPRRSEPELRGFLSRRLLPALELPRSR